MLSCLLDASTPIQERFDGGNEPHLGRSVLRLRTQAGATISFVWASTSYPLPTPSTAPGKALASADLILIGGHASYSLDAWPGALAGLHAAILNSTVAPAAPAAPRSHRASHSLHRLSADVKYSQVESGPSAGPLADKPPTLPATIGLIEVFPAHFPPFEDVWRTAGGGRPLPPGYEMLTAGLRQRPNQRHNRTSALDRWLVGALAPSAGEYGRSLVRYPHTRWFDCVPHRNGSMKADNPWLSTLHQYASTHRLPVSE